MGEPQVTMLARIVEKLQRNVESKAAGDATSVTARVAVLRHLADAAAAASPQQRQGCLPAVQAAVVALIQQTMPPAAAAAAGDSLFQMWKDAEGTTMVAGHKQIVDIVGNPRMRASLASACQVLEAVYACISAAGLAGSLGPQLSDAFSAATPAVDKLVEWQVRLAVVRATAAALLTMTAGPGPAGQPPKEDSRALRQLARGFRDREAVVRAAAFRGISAAAPCCVASGESTAAWDSLFAAASKGMADASPSCKFAAAEAMGDCLWVQQEQSRSQAAASDKRSKRLPSVASMRRRKTASGPLGAVPPDTDWESAAAALARLHSRLGSASGQSGREVVGRLLGTLSVNAAGKNPLAGASEADVLRASRCAAAAISRWSSGCGSEAARVTAARELLSKIAARTADRDRPDAVLLACLAAIPDVCGHLGRAGLQQIEAEAVESLIALARDASLPKLRADAAAALFSMLSLRPGRRSEVCMQLVAQLMQFAPTIQRPESLRSAVGICTLLVAALLAGVKQGVPPEPAPSVVLAQLQELREEDAAADAAGRRVGVKAPADSSFEFSCLVECCSFIATCPASESLSEGYSKLRSWIEPALKGKAPPKGVPEAIRAVRLRNTALSALVFCLRYRRLADPTDATLAADARATGKAITDVFELCVSKELPSGQTGMVGALRRCWSLVYELSHAAAGGGIDGAVARCAVGSLAGWTKTACSVAPRVPMPFAGPANQCCMAPSAFRESGLDLTVLDDTTWYDIVPDAVSHRWREEAGWLSAPLVHERWRRPESTVCIDFAIDALAASFPHLANVYRVNVAGRLRELALQASDRGKRARAADRGPERVVQLNATVGLLVCLQSALASAGPEPVWADDPELEKVVAHAMTAGKVGLSSYCPFIRAAAAELIGAASGLAGKDGWTESFDTHLTQVLQGSWGAEAGALAAAVGAVHGHDKRRFDRIPISLSYLTKLARSEPQVGRGKRTDDDMQADPRIDVLAAASRIAAKSAAQDIHSAADTLLHLAAECALCDQAYAESCPPCQNPSGDPNYAVAAVAAGFVPGLAAALGKGFALISPQATATCRVLLLHGLASPEGAVTAAARENLAELAQQGYAAALQVSPLAQLPHCVACATLPTASVGDAQAALQLICCVAQSAPSEMASAVAAKQMLQLVDVAGARAGWLAEDLHGAVQHVIGQAVSRLQAPDGRRWLDEWVEACEATVTARQRQMEDGVVGGGGGTGSAGVSPVGGDDDDGDDEAAISVSAAAAAVPESPRHFFPSLRGKQVAADLLTHLISSLHHVRQQPQPLAFLEQHFERVMRTLLVAGDDRLCDLLRVAGLNGLTAAVRLFQDVTDRRVDCSYTDEYADPLQRQNSLLVLNQTQLASAARQGLEAGNDDAVVGAAAALADEVLRSCVLPPTSATRLFTTLCKRDPSESEAAALCRIVSTCSCVAFFAGAENERRAGGMTPERQKELADGRRSLPLAVLGSVSGGPGLAAADADGTLQWADVQRQAAGCLRQYAAAKGSAAGWSAPAGTPVPPPSLLQSLDAAAPALVEAAAGCPDSGSVVVGVAASLLHQADERSGDALRGLRCGIEHGALEPASAPFVSQLVSRALPRLTHPQRLAALQCLSSLAETASAAQFAVEGAIAVLTAASPHAFAGLDAGGALRCPPPRDDAERTASVREALSVLQAAVKHPQWAAVGLDVCVRAVAVPGGESAVGSVGASVLLGGGTAPAAVLALAERLLSFELTASAAAPMWQMAALTASALRTSSPDVSRRLLKKLCEAATAGAAPAVAGCVAAVASLREAAGSSEGARAAALDLVLWSLGCGAAVLQGGSAAAAPGGARLALTAVSTLAPLQADAAVPGALAATVAALSAGLRVHADPATSGLLRECMLRLTQQFPDAFRAMVKELPPAESAKLREQMTKPAAAPAAPQAPRPTPKAPPLISISAKAFAT